MTDGLDQALTAAGTDLIAADPTLTVYRGVVPNGATPPYVLVYSAVAWPGPDVDRDNPLDGRSRRPVVTWWCHCVGAAEPSAPGASEVSALSVAQRVRTALLDQRVSVAGVASGLIRLVDAPPTTRDETTGTAVIDAVRVFELHVSV